MRSYTYNLRSLLRPLAFALSLALLTSAPTLLGMEGSGMMIASRNGMAVPKPLLYDAEVEYIESNGTGYLCLEVSGGVADVASGDSYSATLDWWSVSDGNWHCAFSVWGKSGGSSPTPFRMAVYTRPQVNTPSAVVNSGFRAGAWNRYVESAGSGGISLEVNGASAVTSSGYPLSTDRIGVFVRTYDDTYTGVAGSGRCRFGGYRVVKGGVVVLDCVPVRRGTKGLVYEKCSGRFFDLYGTGDFAAGPDKKSASDYVQDGLVAMWDGIENAGWGVHSDSPTDFRELVSGGTVGVGYEYGWSTNIPETPLFTIERDGVRSNDAVINRSVGIGIPYPVSGYTWNYTIEYVRRVHSFATTAGYNPSVVNSYPSQTSTGMLMCQTGNHHIYLLYGGFTGTGLMESLGGCSVTSWGDNTDGREVIVHGVGSFTSGRGQFGVNTNTHICLSSSSCDATLCHLRVYSRALTAAEIAANRAVDEIRFYLPSAS